MFRFWNGGRGSLLDTGGSVSRPAGRKALWLWSWFAAFALLACFALEAGTANRGYDFRDGAYFLVSMADPFRFHYEMSEFSYILHPLYLLCAGRIAIMRVVSLLILCACAAAFGIVTARFCTKRRDTRAVWLIATTIVSSVFWLYEGASRMPDYNKMNVSGLMIIFSVIMAAATPRPPDAASQSRLRAVILGAVAGAALAFVVLAKPTSGVLAAGLGLASLFLLRPPRPWLCVAATAITAGVLLVAFAFAIDGSIFEFVHRKLTALTLLKTRGTDGGTHGIWRSVYGPLIASRRWKLLPIVAFSALLFALYAGAFGALRSRYKALRRGVPALATAATFLLVAWWRAEQLDYPANSPAYLAFHFAIVLVLAAVAVDVGLKNLLADKSRHTVLAALLLSVLPAVYSFGTDSTLLRQISTAPMFWIAAAFLVASLAHPHRHRAIAGLCSGLCSAATLGMMAGVACAPLAVARPIWEQINPVFVGPNRERVLVDAPTADYIRTLQAIAVSHRMKPNTPIIDLSGIGPGSVYAMNGVAPGLPWLHLNGQDPTAFARAVLATVPKRELQCAWVMTGYQLRLGQYAAALNSLGLRFPEQYEKAGSVRSTDLQMQQILWIPRGTAGYCL